MSAHILLHWPKPINHMTDTKSNGAGKIAERRREWKICSGIPYHEGGSFSMLSVLCHFFLVLSSSAWQSAFHNVAPWTSQPQSPLLFHTTLILQHWAAHNSMDLVCKPGCFQTPCHPNASYILVLEASWMSYTLPDPVQPFPLPGMFFTSFSIASWNSIYPSRTNSSVKSSCIPIVRMNHSAFFPVIALITACFNFLLYEPTWVSPKELYELFDDILFLSAFLPEQRGSSSWHTVGIQLTFVELDCTPI